MDNKLFFSCFSEDMKSYQLDLEFLHNIDTKVESSFWNSIKKLDLYSSSRKTDSFVEFYNIKFVVVNIIVYFTKVKSLVHYKEK